MCLTKNPLKSVEIIRPILRGKDIKRYSFKYADLWLINTHNGIKEKSIRRINIDDYPVVKAHLDKTIVALQKRADKGDTPYNLRNCAYMDDFNRQKIVWAETMRVHKHSNEKFPRFGFDFEGALLTDKTCFFAIGSQIKYIMIVLNSIMGKYLCSQYVSILDDGGYLMQKSYIERIPIPYPTSELLDLSEKLMLNIDNSDKIEEKINQHILTSYQLSIEEAKFISSNFQ